MSTARRTFIGRCSARLAATVLVPAEGAWFGRCAERLVPSVREAGIAYFPDQEPGVPGDAAGPGARTENPGPPYPDRR